MNSFSIDAPVYGQLAHVPTGIVCFDSEACPVDCNSAAGKVLGLSRTQVLSGKWEEHGWNVVENDSLSGTGQKGNRKSRQPIATEIRNILRDGRQADRLLYFDSQTDDPRWLQLTAQPIAQPCGTDHGAIVSLTDVTSICRGLESTQYVEAKWREVSQAKSAFIANLSHEIRTPLTAILGFAELLDAQKQSLGNKTQLANFLTPIRRNALHLLRLVNDALDLSKIEAGQLSLYHAPVDLIQTARDIALSMSVPLSQKHVRLHVASVTTVPKLISTDDTRVRQILINLISNAIKFTVQGRVDVRIRFQRRSEATGRLKISVADSGVGMTQPQLAQLFQRFSRLKRDAKAFGGNGLGLHISQKLAGLLGGGIRVRSRLNRGSLFRVTLPVTTIDGAGWHPPTMICDGDPTSASGASGNGEPTTQSLSNGPPQSLDGLRVYLAEDGPDTQLLLSHVLRLAGARVTVFDDGDALLRSMLESAPSKGPTPKFAKCDLIITDMLMPQMDGYEMVATLRDKGCDLPIVALTANAMKGEAERCLLSGCDAYATKPIDRHQLIATCMRCLADKRTSSSHATRETHPVTPSAVHSTGVCS